MKSEEEVKKFLEQVEVVDCINFQGLVLSSRDKKVAKLAALYVLKYILDGEGMKIDVDKA